MGAIDNPTPYSDEEYAELLRVWESLSGAARETLRCLVIHGPTWDGDVPSKSGRDELLRLGLASKAVVKREQGYQVANYKGWAVYRCGKPQEFESPSKLAKNVIDRARGRVVFLSRSDVERITGRT